MEFRDITERLLKVTRYDGWTITCEGVSLHWNDGEQIVVLHRVEGEDRNMDVSASLVKDIRCL